MKFTVYNKKDIPLFTGTKQECMHFIKREKLNRREITIEDPALKIKVQNKEPAPHYTIPITAEIPPPKSFLTRIFSR